LAPFGGWTSIRGQYREGGYCPKEFIERVLSEEFEAQFEQALKECDD
jgi:hypothetical protein